MSAPDLEDVVVAVVVAPGRSLIDVSGDQILGGQIAEVPTQEVANLIATGFIAPPGDKAAERTAVSAGKVGRHAWGLNVAVQNAAGVAGALRPSQPGAAERVKQLIAYATEIGAMAEQLLQALGEGTGP